ncbi:zinc finger BED domain-containing protein RICESLEEPER 2-like protein [Tanacetum coccineum]
MNKSCPALKVGPGSSQTTMRVDGSLWYYKAACVLERITHSVIQETLPFDHFDNKEMTSLIQETLQPRYFHTSRTTLRRDFINLWKLAKDEMILGFGALETSFENLNILSWRKERESQFPILAAMTHDLLTVQASTVASKSSFLVSGTVIPPRRTKLTSLAVEVCICLKDHLDSMKRIQNISPLEGDMERVEEVIHAKEIAMGLSVPLTTQELNEENELYNEDD